LRTAAHNKSTALIVKQFLSEFKHKLMKNKNFFDETGVITISAIKLQKFL